MSAFCPVSVVVITKNEEGRLSDCLESVSWAGEIVVLDDESTDKTLEVARRYTDQIFKRKMDIEGRHRNFAHQQARHDWVLSVDADERVTPELAEEIQALLSGEPACDVYSVPRRNYIAARWLRYGGWYPSPQVKLFRKSVFHWEEATVHPRALTTSTKPWGSLRSDLIHLSYRDFTDFVGKLNRQTTLETQKWLQDGRRMTLSKALWRSFDRFFRSYRRKKGFRDGFVGYFAAVHGGFYQFLSYAKYWHAKRSSVQCPVSSVSEKTGHVACPPGLTRPPAGAGGVSSWRAGDTGRGTRSSLSAVILTKNAAHTLGACLDSVKWADEVIVVDGGSTDGTVELARKANAQVVSDATHDDFSFLRNLGAKKASGDWILQLDADEVVTPAFRLALQKLLANGSSYAAYKFRRQNVFLGRLMRHGGWDHLSLHLFQKGRARYEGRVHEKLIVEGTVGTLRAGVIHTPFRSIEEFMDRQNRYTSLEARGLVESGEARLTGSVRWQTTVKPIKLFWKMYVKKLGFLEGMHGFTFAGLFAYVHFLKWAKVWEILDEEPPR